MFAFLTSKLRPIAKKLRIGTGIWLGGRDSNPDTQIQNLQSYRWTTSQQGGTAFAAEPARTRQNLLYNVPFYNLCPTIA